MLNPLGPNLVRDGERAARVRAESRTAPRPARYREVTLTPRRLASLAILALVSLALRSQAGAQAPDAPAPLPPLSQPTPDGNPLPGMDSLGGVEPDQIPDMESALVDGFTEVIMEERLNDPRTAAIRKEFVKGIEAAVGKDGTAPFDWALLDLNGDGYNDLVIQPRATGVREKPGFDGIRAVVYVFNGTTWNLALDSGAMNIAFKVIEHEDGPNQYQIAMVQEQGYVLYEWNGKVFERTSMVDTSRWPKRGEPEAGKEPVIPGVVVGKPQ